MDDKKALYFKIIAGLGLLAITIIAVAAFLRGGEQQGTAKEMAGAAAAQTVLTSQADWEAGDNVLTDLISSSGEIKMNNEGSEIDLKGMFEDDESIVTATHQSSSRGNLIDKDEETRWGDTLSPGDSMSWDIDLGDVYLISKIRMFDATSEGSPFGMAFKVSLDGSDWTTIPAVVFNSGGWEEYSPDPPLEARYFRVNSSVDPMWMDPVSISAAELELYVAGVATHTSSPTQITHSDLYEWETFTPNYTKPENTNIEFRFKTSKDSESWTDWTSYQTPASGSPLDISSLVTSREGELGEEDFYKYFQVETRLTSTDGVSTPTLSDYSVGYHTNVAPAKPTTGGVVIGN